MCLQYRSFENIVGKGKIAHNEQIFSFSHNEQFLLFPQRFVPVWRIFLPFSLNLKLSSANSLSLEESKFCRLGKGKTIALFVNVYFNLKFAAAVQIRKYVEAFSKCHVAEDNALMSCITDSLPAAGNKNFLVLVTKAYFSK